MLRIISNRDSNSVTVQALDKNAQEILLGTFPNESRTDGHSWHFKDAYVYYENQIVTIVSSKDSRDKYQKKLFVTSLVNTIIEFR